MEAWQSRNQPAKLVGNLKSVTGRIILRLHRQVASFSGWTFTNKLEQPESLQEETLAIQRKILGDEHPEVSTSLSSLADNIRRNKNLEEAETVSGAAVWMQRRMLGDDSPEVLKSLRRLGLTLEAGGKYQEAEAIYREVLAGGRKREGSESPQALSALESVARVLVSQKNLAKLTAALQ